MASQTEQQEGSPRHETVGVSAETLQNSASLNEALFHFEAAHKGVTEASKLSLEESKANLEETKKILGDSKRALRQLDDALKQESNTQALNQAIMAQLEEERDRLGPVLEELHTRVGNIANELLGEESYDHDATIERRELVVSEGAKSEGLAGRMKKLEQAAKDAGEILHRLIDDRSLTLKHEIETRERAAGDWVNAEKALQRGYYNQEALQARVQELFEILKQCGTASASRQAKYDEAKVRHDMANDRAVELLPERQAKVERIKELEEEEIPGAEYAVGLAELAHNRDVEVLQRVQAVMPVVAKLPTLLETASGRLNLTPELTEQLNRQGSSAIKGMVTDAEGELSTVQPGKGVMLGIGATLGRWQERLDAASEELKVAGKNLEELVRNLDRALEKATASTTTEKVDLEALEDVVQQADLLKSFLEQNWPKIQTPERADVDSICEQSRAAVEKALQPLNLMRNTTRLYEALLRGGSEENEAALCEAFRDLAPAAEKAPVEKEPAPEAPVQEKAPIAALEEVTPAEELPVATVAEQPVVAQATGPEPAQEPVQEAVEEAPAEEKLAPGDFCDVPPEDVDLPVELSPSDAAPQETIRAEEPAAPVQEEAPAPAEAEPAAEEPVAAQKPALTEEAAPEEAAPEKTAVGPAPTAPARPRGRQRGIR